MTALSRAITTSILDWRGILIRVTYEQQRFADHLQVETLEPQRAPLPITETGYRSTFLPKATIPATDDPAAYVEAWLDEAAKLKHWGHLEMQVRQYALLCRRLGARSARHPARFAQSLRCQLDIASD